MTWRARATFVIGALLVPVAAGPSTTAAQESIAGRVLDTSGEPVAGARVVALRDLAPPGAPAEIVLAEFGGLEDLVDPRPPETATNGDGEFVLSGLEPRWYTVRVLASGFSASEERGVEVLKQGLTFTLHAAEAYDMQVTDAVSKLPVAGATVSVYRSPAAGAALLDTLLEKSRPPLEVQRTDEAGRSRFVLLGDGRYDVVARVPGYQESARRAVPISGARSPLGLELAAGRTIKGIVRGADRKPLGGAVVSVQLDDAREAPPAALRGVEIEEAVVATGADGRFSFDTLKDGRHTLIVRHPRWVSGRRSGLVPDGRDLEITLAQGIRLPGTVIDRRTQKGVVGATVAVHDIGRHRKHATTDAEGRFTLSGVPSGRASVIEVSAPGYVPVWREVPAQRSPSEPVPIRFELSRPGTVEGRVERPGGAPASSAFVCVYRIVGERERFIDHGRTSLDGTFRIGGLPPGEPLRIAARLEPFLPGWSEVFRLRPGAVASGLDLALARGGSIRGRIVDAEGRTLEGASVRLRSPGSPAPVRTIDTDASGRYDIESIPPGTYVVSARARGFFQASRSVEVVDSRGVEAGDTVLAKGHVLSGRVVDAAGAPVSGAEAVVRWVDGGGGEARAPSGDDGAFRAAGILSNSAVRVTVVHPDFATPRWKELPVTGEPSDFVLTRLPVLKGRVEYPHGKAARIFTVQPVEIRPLERFEYLAKRRFESEDGSFEYPGVPAGRYRLQLRAAGLNGLDLEVVEVGSKPLLDLGTIRLETFAAGPAVAGVVLHAGNPVEGATVRITEGRAAFLSRRFPTSLTTNRDGVFGFGYMLGGRFTVEVTHPAFAVFRLEDVDPSRSESRRLEIELMLP